MRASTCEHAHVHVQGMCSVCACAAGSLCLAALHVHVLTLTLTLSLSLSLSLSLRLHLRLRLRLSLSLSLTQLRHGLTMPSAPAEANTAAADGDAPCAEAGGAATAHTVSAAAHEVLPSPPPSDTACRSAATSHTASWVRLG